MLFRSTRCIYRCYGWSYPYAEMYYPDRLAAAISEGTRNGGVAVDADGEVVAHCGWVEVAEGAVMVGAAVTDPRYRRRGLLEQVLVGFGVLFGLSAGIAFTLNQQCVNAVMDRQGPKPELLIVATDGDTPWSGRKHKIPVVVALTRTAYVSRVPKWMTVVDLNPRRS